MKIAPTRRQTSERRSREEQPCCLSWLWTDARDIFKPKVRKWQLQLCLKPKASKAVTMFESKKEKTWGLLFLLIIYWTVIESQCCAIFRCATVWVSSVCTQTPSLLRLPRPPLPPALGHPGAGAELLFLGSSPPAPCFTRGRVLTAVPLFQFVPLSPSPPPNPCCVSIISDILCHSVPFVRSSPRRLPVPHSSDESRSRPLAVRARE